MNRLEKQIQIIEAATNALSGISDPAEPADADAKLEKKNRKLTEAHKENEPAQKTIEHQQALDCDL